MKRSKGEITVYSVFVLVLIMVNPPVINLVNRYCIVHPLTFGWPTMQLWLNFWYIIAIVTFLLGVLIINSWKKDYDEEDCK